MNRIIFVVGGKHCGTTLSATILGVNSKCHLIPMETGAYSFKFIEQIRKPFIRQVSEIDSEVVVEKTPDHVYQIDKIQEDWPNSPIFVITRNPIDRVASTTRRHGNFNQSVYECSNDLTACINAMEKPNTFLVSYEQIVKDFRNVVGQMCYFAQLQFEERMVNFHEHSPTWFEKKLEDDHHRLRSNQMKTPLYDDSGWGKEYLTIDQIDQVKIDCMEKYNSLMSYSTVDSKVLPTLY